LPGWPRNCGAKLKPSIFTPLGSGAPASSAKVGNWSAAKTVTLTDSEFADLDGYLSSLCLATVTNEAPPPPGGTFDAEVTGRSGEKRLGERGSTGGSYFLLAPNERSTLFQHCMMLAPVMRNCHLLTPHQEAITGELVTTARTDDASLPKEKLPLVLLDSMTCVADPTLGDADPKKFPVQSVALVLKAGQPIPQALVHKRVTVSGILTATERGDTAVLHVDTIGEAK